MATSVTGTANPLSVSEIAFADSVTGSAHQVNVREIAFADAFISAQDCASPPPGGRAAAGSTGVETRRAEDSDPAPRAANDNTRIG